MNITKATLGLVLVAGLAVNTTFGDDWSFYGINSGGVSAASFAAELENATRDLNDIATKYNVNYNSGSSTMELISKLNAMNAELKPILDKCRENELHAEENDRKLREKLGDEEYRRVKQEMLIRQMEAMCGVYDARRHANAVTARREADSKFRQSTGVDYRPNNRPGVAGPMQNAYDDCNRTHQIFKDVK